MSSWQRPASTSTFRVWQWLTGQGVVSGIPGAIWYENVLCFECVGKIRYSLICLSGHRAKDISIVLNPREVGLGTWWSSLKGPLDAKCCKLAKCVRYQEESTDILCKGPDSKYSRPGRSYKSLYQLLDCSDKETNTRQNVNQWARLCSNKILLVDSGIWK